MQRDAGVVGEGLEDVSREGPDEVAADDDVLLAGRLTGVHDVGAPGDVDDDAGAVPVDVIPAGSKIVSCK